MKIVRNIQPSLKAVFIAAGLVFAHAHATSQTGISSGLGQQMLITDPLGSGRSTYIMLLSGSSNTTFGAGDYAVTSDVFDIGGALGWINASDLLVSGVNGTTVSPALSGTSVRKILQAETNISSLSLQLNGPGTGRIDSVNLTGGVTMSGTRITGILTGGALKIDGIRANLEGGQVIANLSGTKAGVGTKPAVAYNSPNTVLWTFDPLTDVTGLASIDAASLFSAEPVAALQAKGYTNVRQNPDGTIQFTASNKINNLSLTASGASFLTNALGLLATGQDAMNATNDALGKWGSINTSLNFVAGVPEPSTYALMGLGFVGLSLAAHRKKARHCA